MRKKSHFKSLLLKELYFSGSLSSVELSDRIKKSIPFTTNLIDELEENGFVIEAGYAASSGGRRPVIYTLKSETVYMLAVAMDQLITRICIMDVQNQVVGEVHEFELPLANNPIALEQLCQSMEKVIAQSGIDRQKMIGAGVGMPGFIDTKKGINYSFLKSKDRSITQYLSESLQIPVYIDNDSSIIALAEYRFGAARSYKNVMVINIGWGIGLGMIINGDLFRGQNGFAGEFSHIPLFDNNKLCSCGKTGCLETESSLLTIVEKAMEGLSTGRKSALNHGFPTGDFEEDSKSIIDAGLNGDQFAIELLSDLGYNIGRGIAILIHLLNPESVILSGRGARAGKVLLASVQQAMNKDCIPSLAANTTLEVSSLGHEAELIGAAALVIEGRVKQRVVNEKEKSVSVK